MQPSPQQSRVATETQAVRAGSGEMFDTIADRYDLLNRLMSLGLDHGWRRRLVRAVLEQAEICAPILDIATGTADVALALARAEPRTAVVGVDPSSQMLRHAQQKVVTREAGHRITFTRADGQRLPFGDDSAAGCCIAFGIRNVPDRSAALREMARVTRSGGAVAVLELSEPEHGFLKSLTRWHIRRVIPTIGGWLSGSREYRYLQRSMAAFPRADVFEGLMREAGLRDVSTRRMGFGAVHLFRGTVP